MQILFAKNKNCNAFSGKMQDKPTIRAQKENHIHTKREPLTWFPFCGADLSRPACDDIREIQSAHKKRTTYVIPFLRCRRDSNSRPPAWQADILTNWTTAPRRNELGYRFACANKAPCCSSSPISKCLHIPHRCSTVSTLCGRLRIRTADPLLVRQML